MKATADRKALADAVKAAARFLPRRTSMSVIENLYIETHSGIIAITATDLEAGRRVEVEASVDTEGEALVPVAFAGILAKATGAEVELSATEKNLVVRSGGTSWRLPLKSGIEDYPKTEPTGGTAIRVDHWSRVREIANFASRDNARPILQGVRFEGVEAVATDHYRLGWAPFAEGLGVEYEPFLIPAHGILNLDQSVTSLHVTERAVRAKLEDGAWWCRLIDGSFPQWRSLVKDYDPAAVVTVSSEALLDAIGRARPVLDKAIPVRLFARLGEIRIVVGDPEEPAFSEVIDAEVTGEAWAAFNADYLASVVAPVEKVTIEIENPGKLVQVSGDWYSAAIMPVRLGS